MKQKTALIYCKKRKKLLKERNIILLERFRLNKHLRQVTKELNGIDTLLVHGD